MTQSESFAERRRRFLESKGKPLPDEEVKEKPSPIDDDLIPDIYGERSEEDLEIDSIIDSIGILDAYRKWIGKEVDESTTNKVEGIMVSCPIPGHRDKKPSAWLNSDKKTYHCGVCEEGGDVYDLAAIKFDYPRPDYKTGKMFHELRQEMVEDYGYKVKRVGNKEIVWQEEESQQVAGSENDEVPPVSREAPESRSTPDDEDSEHSEQASVVTLHAKDVEFEPDEEIDYPTINWKKIVPKDTFLWEYMEACSNDDSPEEYHFWHGLLALGHAVGRNVYLDDLKDVYGNMMVCLLGGTGYGKTRSRSWLETVIEEAVPWDRLSGKGCRLVPIPASGENLIKQFEFIQEDPTNPKAPGIEMPVNGIVDYDEFAGLLSRAMRQGSTLKVYVQQFADSRNRITSSSNTGGTIEAFQPYCSITASTQPKSVRTLLSRYDTGSGFLNRWVFIGGKRKKRESIGGKRSAIRVDLKAAITHLKAVRGWGAVSREVELTDDGYEAWDKWFHGEIEPLQLNDETDLLPRLGLTMKRLLLLFAINDKKTEINADDVERIKPLIHYLIKCYSILNSEIGITLMGEIAQDIIRHVGRIEEKTGRGASARDIVMNMKRSYSPDHVRKALDTMVALDMIDTQKPEKGVGRPTIRYKVVEAS